MDDWRDNLVESDAGMAAILADSKRIAVLGISHEAVAEALARAGIKVVQDR